MDEKQTKFICHVININLHKRANSPSSSKIFVPFNQPPVSYFLRYQCLGHLYIFFQKFEYFLFFKILFNNYYLKTISTKVIQILLIKFITDI